jgi:hypothetical protein
MATKVVGIERRLHHQEIYENGEKYLIFKIAGSVLI